MGSVSTTSKDRLNVLIVGGGIAGLAAATGIAKKGHNVTVLEQDKCLNEFGASIGILANGVRPLKAWGLATDFEKVVTKNGFIEVRDAFTNEKLGHNPMNKNGFADLHYGEEIWNINRIDYQKVLAVAAESNGAKIIFDAKLETIDVEQCIAILKDGREVRGDVIVGADGNQSAVRANIPATAHIKPVGLEEECFRCTVPKDKMRGNPKLEWLLHVGNEFCWTGPGRYVLSWPLPDHRPYDVVTCVQRDCSMPPGKWGVRATADEARRDFADFCPEVTELLANIDTAVKWRLCELPPLETFRSENGRVVLIGDAAHAMIPHSASGGNSAIEDAACLSECLDWVFRNDKDIAIATKAFEDLRKQRVERMQNASQEGYSFLGAKGDFLPIRDQMLKVATKEYDRELALPEETRRSMEKPEADMYARFPSEPYLQWLYGYDAIDVTKKYLATLG